jgi:hypothetical protein
MVGGIALRELLSKYYMLPCFEFFCVCFSYLANLANRQFVNVSQFKYLGTTVTNQNLIQEEIKRRLNSGNACYHLVQSLLSSRQLSKNLKIRIYKTIILPVVLYECETGL